MNSGSHILTGWFDCRLPMAFKTLGIFRVTIGTVMEAPGDQFTGEYQFIEWIEWGGIAMKLFRRSVSLSCHCQKDEALSILKNAAAVPGSSFVLKSINGNEICLKVRNPSPFGRDSFQPEIWIRILEAASGSYLHASFSLQNPVRIGLIVFYSIAFLLELLLIVCGLFGMLTEPWLALLFPVFLAVFLCMVLVCFRKNTGDAVSVLTDLFP